MNNTKQYLFNKISWDYRFWAASAALARASAEASLSSSLLCCFLPPSKQAKYDSPISLPSTPQTLSLSLSAEPNLLLQFWISITCIFIFAAAFAFIWRMSFHGQPRAALLTSISLSLHIFVRCIYTCGKRTFHAIALTKPKGQNPALAHLFHTKTVRVCGHPK
jgi:hypothetical protein